jgi:hypothetical protein
MFDFENDSPQLQISESDEETLVYNSPQGYARIDAVIAGAPWLQDYIRHQWAPRGEDGFEDAFSSIARIIAVAATLDSINPDDLAYALGLPLVFVRIVLIALQGTMWRCSLLPALRSAIGSCPDVRAFKALIDNFVMGEEFPPLRLVDVLKAVGQAVRGLGRSPFELKNPNLTGKEQLVWLSALPKSQNQPPASVYKASVGPDSEEGEADQTIWWVN